MYVLKAREDLRVELRYNADLFDAVRMEVVLDQFFNLLRQIIAEPDKRIRSYSLLTDTSRHAERRGRARTSNHQDAASTYSSESREGDAAR